MLGVFSYPFLESSPAPRPECWPLLIKSLSRFFFFQPQKKPVPTRRGLGKKEGGPSMASSWGSSRVVFKTHCFLVLAVLGPHCWAWAFRSCLGGGSRCRARALGLQRVSGGGTGLSLFPVVLGPSRPGIKPCPLPE